MPSRPTSASPAPAAVRREFARLALVWSIPALLILPIYLVLIALSAVAADGAILEATDGVRGGINAAIGPLLFVCGAVAMTATLMLAQEPTDYITGLGALVGCWLVGWHLSSRALAGIRKSI